ncbi:MAG: hypothetical protein Q8S21_01910 [Candidatus Paracaedibacteraceae bacterium]|nr:hypothetical protein [Candidatus Paracaedibacteraceae bacterium]
MKSDYSYKTSSKKMASLESRIYIKSYIIVLICGLVHTEALKADFQPYNNVPQPYSIGPTPFNPVDPNAYNQQAKNNITGQPLTQQAPVMAPTIPQQAPAVPPVVVNNPNNVVLQPTTPPAEQQTLDAQITDIPSTFTFRTSCIKQSYNDTKYGKLNEPYLVKEQNGIYTIHATCLSGSGIPILDSTLSLILVVRNLDQRSISIRSNVNGQLKNCADIANNNGKLVCIPYDNAAPQ